MSAYSETGKFENPKWKYVDTTKPDDYAAMALTWIEMGVQVVGGCCGTLPDHIKALKGNAADEPAPGGVAEIAMTELSARLAQGEIIILDGAISSEIQRRGVALDRNILGQPRDAGASRNRARDARRLHPGRCRRDYGEHLRRGLDCDGGGRLERG